ncbi:DUF4299 family protein [Streptococcus sanguinis]|uniref:DUF4299 family protein n=1 Tax=Streptococcus sanguinis TaxID=1305 RepID=A0A7H8V9V7_STRSA|nr:DUF4299 family protein [Streptococcus sanguinis]
MKSVSFTIKSNQSLRIGELLQADLFECYSVSAKDAGLKPFADSLISDFHSVQFGVKGKSSLGFRLSFDSQVYQVSVPDLATASDWTGALMFLKTLLLILDVNVCEHDGVDYDKDSILDFHFTDIFLAALSELTKEVKVHPIVEIMGVKRPIYINELYLGQIIHVPDEQLLNSYDQRLRFTQQLNAYYSEQQVFKVEQDGEDIIIPINYLNSEARTVLLAQPELEPQYLQQYQGSKVAVARLFIMTADGEKLAEVPYRQYLESLTEGIYMLDAKYVLVDPISPETLQEILEKLEL